MQILLIPSAEYQCTSQPSSSWNLHFHSRLVNSGPALVRIVRRQQGREGGGGEGERTREGEKEGRRERRREGGSCSKQVNVRTSSLARRPLSMTAVSRTAITKVSSASGATASGMGFTLSCHACHAVREVCDSLISTWEVLTLVLGTIGWGYVGLVPSLSIKLVAD